MNGAKLKNWLSSTTSASSPSSSSASKDRRKSLREILSTGDSSKRKLLKPKLNSTRLQEDLGSFESTSQSEPVEKKSVVQRPILKEGNWTSGDGEKSTNDESNLTLEETTRSLAVSSVDAISSPKTEPEPETDPSLAQPDTESVPFGTATARGVLAPATRFPPNFGKSKDPALGSETDNDWRSALGSELEEEERMDVFENSIAFNERTYSALPEAKNSDASIIESYDFHDTGPDGERRLTFPPFRTATPESGQIQNSEPWTGRGELKNVHESNDDDLEQLLSSTSRLFPLNDLEASYVETYKQDVSDIVELRGKVERVQRQLKQVRRYMKELARAEMQKYVPAAIVIQSHWRGYVVRRQLASLGIFPSRAFMSQRWYCSSALRQELSGIGLAGTSTWSDDMRVARNEQRRGIVFLQAMIRGVIVRRKVSEFLDDLGIAHRAATMIQAVWRGHRCRKEHSLMFRIARSLKRMHLAKVDDLMGNMARMADQLSMEREERKRQDEVLRHLIHEITKLKEQVDSNKEKTDSKETEIGKSEQTPSSCENVVSNLDVEPIHDGDRYAIQIPTKIDLLSPHRANPGLSPIIPPTRPESKFVNATSTDLLLPPSIASVVQPNPVPQIHSGTGSTLSPVFDVSRFVGIDDYEYLKAEVDCLRLNYENVQIVLDSVLGIRQDRDDDGDMEDHEGDRTLLHDC